MNIQYAYDQNCKNKITSIHYLPITYENTTSLYIKSYLNLSFNYEGNRLMTVINSITNVTTLFTYDENGLRRTKTNSDGTTTNYYYSGNRLVTEINKLNTEPEVNLVLLTEVSNQFKKIIDEELEIKKEHS